MRVFGHHVEVTSPTRARQLVAQRVILYLVDDGFYGRRIGTAVQGLVLRPRLAHQLAEGLEVIALDGLGHVERMGFHLAQQGEVRPRIEEHGAHDFRQNAFGRAGDARVVEQVAGAVFGLDKQVVGQPAHEGLLNEARLRLQELDALEYAAILVLPTAARGEQLLEGKGAAAHLVLVPRKAAEVAQRTQHGRRQDGAGAQA